MATYEDIVSVPLRGLWFLSKEGRFYYENLHLFPSPCGDYGSYQRLPGAKWVSGRGMFPSPCGDYGSYPRGRRMKCCLCHKVFPSPCGDYGSYRRVAKADTTSRRLSFRPLAGIMVLILSGTSKT